MQLTVLNHAFTEFDPLPTSIMCIISPRVRILHSRVEINQIPRRNHFLQYPHREPSNSMLYSSINLKNMEGLVMDIFERKRTGKNGRKEKEEEEKEKKQGDG